MSDLQCAARFLVLAAVDDDAVERLRDERVAMVYDARPGAADDPPLAGHLTRAADRLGVAVTPAEPIALAELRDRVPATVDVLRGLADLHRGETVVVRALGEPDAWLEVLVDGDGVTVTGHGASSAR